MAKKKSQAKATSSRKAKAKAPAQHRSFRRTSQTTKPAKLAAIPSARRVVRDSLGLLWQGKWLFGRIILLHIGLLALLALDPVSQSTQVYTSILLVLMSMAEIWLIRQLNSGEPAAIKPALYQGTSQVMAFGLSALLLVLQLLPFVVGLWLFQVVVVGGVAIRLAEQAIFAVLWLGLGLLSWYWAATSLLAIYIVTLPGLTPLQAWHTAKPLVEGRRATLLMRVLVLVIVLAVLGYCLILPVPSDWLVNYNVLALIVAVLLPIWHVYMYKLYRALV